MRECSICGNKVEDNVENCPKCGHLMSFSSKPKNLETSPVVFDEEEKKTLQKGCKTVSIVWLIIGILALLPSILVVVLYYEHFLQMFELILYLICLGTISFLGFFGFGQYQKYKHWVENNTKKFIDKFKHYKNFSVVLVVAVMFFSKYHSILLVVIELIIMVILTIPLILTYKLISSKLNAILNELEQRTGKIVDAKKDYTLKGHYFGLK